MNRSPALSKGDFEALSEFRYQLRRFLHFSEEAAKAHGLTPLQYQLMLQIKGFPGRDWASVGELAERLQARHHGVVALLGRCEAAGLVTRTPGSTDRRVVEVRLTPLGDRLVRRVAALHQQELQSLSGVFRVARLTMLNDQAGEPADR
jgi:DNA-binding MarR family transcriptional regulator